MDVTLDKLGRIVIPKPVRDALGLETSAKLHLETTEGENGDQEIALRPERERPALQRKGGSWYIPARPLSLLTRSMSFAVRV